MDNILKDSNNNLKNEKIKINLKKKKMFLPSGRRIPFKI